MSSPAYALFETPIGDCAIVWAEHGVIGVYLPEADAPATRARLLRRHRDAVDTAPPPDVQAAVDAIVALLHGARDDDLQSIALDLGRIPEFNRRVYAIARAIPPGQTRTYGEIAAELGDVGLARAVGQALGANPFPIVVPCHRVMAAGGRAGGFSAPGGLATKLKLLEIERAPLGGAPGLFD
ncbi:MAG TPA: methylated-DNA--[protein]-cysteine S-methyltransferase [Burkholderiaceae bacterium]|nr:methylated-DNA--[protein]-cysteine S-methyltransferase [Burkholderiaceae bacterium]